MKKTIWVTLFLVFGLHGLSQRHGDAGIFLGGSYYLGEINPTKHFRDLSESYGFFYRHNFNLRYALRTSFYSGSLKGFDSHSEYPFQKLRKHSFNRRISELSCMLEFNFLPYISTHDVYNQSFYVTGGLGYFFTSGKVAGSNLTFPFGVGYKANLAKRWSAGIEWTLRKPFTDELDGLGEPDNDPLNDFLALSQLSDYKQRALPNRVDVYFFTGIFLSYKLFYTRFRCPAYEDSKMVY